MHIETRDEGKKEENGNIDHEIENDHKIELEDHTLGDDDQTSLPEISNQEEMGRFSYDVKGRRGEVNKGWKTCTAPC